MLGLRRRRLHITSPVPARRQRRGCEPARERILGPEADRDLSARIGGRHAGKQTRVGWCERLERDDVDRLVDTRTLATSLS